MNKLTLLTLFPVLFFQTAMAQGFHVENPPAACECQFAGKDYDPAKGYYFDKVTYLPIPKVSGRFGCQYYCQDTQGKFWYVTHVYQDYYFGTRKGGPENAKKMICPQSVAEFIPRYDEIGHVKYYDTEPVGNFSGRSSRVPEIREWASKNCSP